MVTARVQKKYPGPVLLAEDLRAYEIPWKRSATS
jgi:hypothetical protein